MSIEKHIARARSSAFGMWKLNFGLQRLVPFNRPHGIKIVQIEDDLVKAVIPFKRKNLNHIKGIHACGMATAAEFSSGFLLLWKLGEKKYRLIMESLEVQYHYQAKTNVTATFHMTPEWMQEFVFKPLDSLEQVLVRCEIKLYDTVGNHVATAHTNWQIKPWSKVKTRV